MTNKETKIFISYRRQDSQQMAERINEALDSHFPVIFYDITAIESGRDFADKIQQGIYESDVVLVLINNRWADIMQERRDQANDHVRIEIETALEQRKRVIPLLIGNTPMPSIDVFPHRIGERFTHLNAQEMHTTGDHFKLDIDKLIETLKNWETLQPPKPLPPTRPPQTQGLLWRQVAGGLAIIAVFFAVLALFGLTNRDVVVVEATRLVAQTVETTRLVEQTIEVTRIAGGVPVTQIVEQTVEIPVITIATEIVEQTIEVPMTEIVEIPVTSIMTQIIEIPVTQVVEQTVEIPVTEIIEITSPPIIITATPPPTPTSPPVPRHVQVAIDGVRHNYVWSGFAGADGYSQIFDNGNVQTEMMLVPAGEFEMGSSHEDAGDDETPHSQVIENPFWISKYEVTNEQFVEFLRAIGNISSEGIEYIDAGDDDIKIQKVMVDWRVKSNFENHPVVEVTWFGARDFCKWLGEEFRLPTEKEWEYAASGPSNWEYPWWGEWNENNAVWSGNSGGQTAIVGSRSSGASWVGAMDMSGSVWEWVSSLYQDYPYSKTYEDDTNNTDPRITHGGSWLTNSIGTLSASNRFSIPPSLSDRDRGFRCARDYTP